MFISARAVPEPIPRAARENIRITLRLLPPDLRPADRFLTFIVDLVPFGAAASLFIQDPSKTVPLCGAMNESQPEKFAARHFARKK